MMDGRLALTDADKVSALQAFFENVYRPPDIRNPSALFEVPVAQVSDLAITVEEVYMELKSLNKHKSTGPDGLHPAIVEPISDMLQSPTANLFPATLRVRQIPADRKTDMVVALHRSGPKQMVENYHPVNLTSIICKCLEKIIRK